ncbi:hypothetical protein [Thermococcus sp.]|uniref:hypothetical protein n=1 Tax=Thermococcus sp. TaxID=35749 RepID=UPI0025DCF1D9|nr:hypothetical protein [Thermococcus sp.]
MMPVKRLAAVMVVFLVLGLTASSAMAASDVVPNLTQSSSQTSGCLCCSENISSYKDLKVQVLRGATSYLIAMHVLSRDIPDIQGHLNQDVKLVRPQYYLAYVRIGKVGNSTVEQVVIPLLIKTENGEYNGVLLSLRNSTGVYSVLAIQMGSEEIYGTYIERSLNGTIKDSGTLHILFDKKLVQKYSISPQSKIVVPLDKFMKVCTWTVSKLCEKGFGRFLPCAFCWAAPLWPIGPIVCSLVCWYLEDKFNEKICKSGAEALCRKLAETLVIIE